MKHECIKCASFYIQDMIDFSSAPTFHFSNLCGKAFKFLYFQYLSEKSSLSMDQ